MPEITPGCRKAAEEIFAAFGGLRSAKPGANEATLDICTDIIARNTRDRELREALENVTASLETMWVCFFHHQPMDAKEQRQKLIEDARALLATLDAEKGGKNA